MHKSVQGSSKTRKNEEFDWIMAGGVAAMCAALFAFSWWFPLAVAGAIFTLLVFPGFVGDPLPNWFMMLRWFPLIGLAMLTYDGRGGTLVAVSIGATLLVVPSGARYVLTKYADSRWSVHHILSVVLGLWICLAAVLLMLSHPTFSAYVAAVITVGWVSAWSTRNWYIVGLRRTQNQRSH